MSELVRSADFVSRTEINLMMFKYWQLAMTKHYAKFDGRSSRAEYWWMALVNAIILVVLAILMGATNSALFTVLYVAFAIATFIPHLSNGIRRLHDTGRGGAWILIGLVPFVGFIILIVFLASAGQPGPNQYGVPPAPLVA